MDPAHEDKSNPYQPSAVPSERRALTFAEVWAFFAVAGVLLGLSVAAFLVSALATSHVIMYMRTFADRTLWSCVVGSVAALTTLAVGIWKSIRLLRPVWYFISRDQATQQHNE